MLDNAIQTWVVDPEHQVGLDQLKKTHRIDCLRVFNIDDTPVPPRDVASVLQGKITVFVSERALKTFSCRGNGRSTFCHAALGHLS